MSKTEKPVTTIENDPSVTTGQEVTHAVALTDQPSPTGNVVGLRLGGGIVIKGVKTVTRPVLKQLDGVKNFIKIVKAIHKGEEFVGEGRDGKPKMEPAHIMFVVDLETGIEMTFIANAALRSGLEREYKDESYVGKYFSIESRLRPHDGGRKQIREYFVLELEVEGAI